MLVSCFWVNGYSYDHFGYCMIYPVYFIPFLQVFVDPDITQTLIQIFFFSTEVRESQGALTLPLTCFA